MSLRGHGAVAIWHDLDPAARDEFYQWHGREHMPERMAIPGFRRGRRYRVVGDGPEFFNLYEADSLGVLAGPDYLARLNAPTPWTRAVVARFRDVARSACVVRWSAGVGEGGWLRSLRFDDDGRLAALASGVLPAIAGRSGIAGVHLLVDDRATSGIDTRERAARGEAADVPPHIVLIEGVGSAQVEAAGAIVAAGLPGLAAATYVLEHATEGDGG